MIYLELQCGSKWFVPVSSSIKKRKKKASWQPVSLRNVQSTLYCISYWEQGPGSQFSSSFARAHFSSPLLLQAPHLWPGWGLEWGFALSPFLSIPGHSTYAFYFGFPIPIGNKKIGIRARTEVVCCIIFLLRGNRFSEQFSLTLFLDTKMPLGN